MSASLRLRIGVVAAGLSCLILGHAAAQQAQSSAQIRPDRNAGGQTDRSSTLQSDRSTSERTDATNGESEQHRIANYRGDQTKAGGLNQAIDRYLASCLLAKNECEVQLSELAQQKTTNPDVKQFAQEMIRDHRKMIEQLQPLAGMQAGAKRGVSGPLGTRTETDRGTASAAPSTETTTDVAAGARTTDRPMAGGSLQQLAQIDKQIGERVLQATREELQQKSGAEFDKCYIGTAIGAHVHALAALEVIGQQTQGPLAQVAQQAQPTVQQHLEHAKQLMKQLEGQASAKGTQAVRQSTRTE